MRCKPAIPAILRAVKDREWMRLAELRELFLSGEAGEDYWRSEHDLELYHRFFGQRIAWKWSCVLAELRSRGWHAPQGEFFDWGCGSGVALRSLLEDQGQAARSARLHDRSGRALEFARKQILATFPDLPLSSSPASADEAPALLLISHVLPELDEAGKDELAACASRSTAIIWIEDGSRSTSRKLCAMRDRLLEGGAFAPIAPCPHDAACGVLAAGQDEQWCHHFARPAGDVYTNADWSHFSRRLGIDRRSLPYSFLVLDRRPAAAGVGGEEQPSAAEGRTRGRIIGRPSMRKGHAMLHVCEAAGVRECRLLQRADKALFKDLKDCAGQTLAFTWKRDGERLSALERELPPLPDEADDEVAEQAGS